MSNYGKDGGDEYDGNNEDGDGNNGIRETNDKKTRDMGEGQREYRRQPRITSYIDKLINYDIITAKTEDKEMNDDGIKTDGRHRRRPPTAMATAGTDDTTTKTTTAATAN